MRVRDLPRKVDGLPVVKAAHLGWLESHSAEPGYFCAVITYGTAHTGKGENFHLHLLRALGLDRPWHRMESSWDLRNGEANAGFKEYEKLADWPEGNSK